MQSVMCYIACMIYAECNVLYSLHDICTLYTGSWKWVVLMQTAKNKYLHNGNGSSTFVVCITCDKFLAAAAVRSTVASA